MKRTTLSRLITVSLFGATSVSIAQGLGSGSLFSRVDDQATKVTQAYAAIYENFYGVGKAWLMMKAALDVRPDGTPNITLDREAQKAQFTIRLSVNEPVYNAWKADAHRRIEAVGMSVKFSDFEDTEARVIGGKFYRLGDNEESALRRWESSDKPAKKAELVVRVELVNSNGNAVRQVDLPISEFRRLGFDAFPLPLHHLNRLQDLPLDRFQWGSLDGMRRSLSDALRKVDPNARIEGDSVEAIRRALEKAEANLDPSKRFKWGDVEDAYANFTLTRLTDAVMNSIVDVRCTVIDDEILSMERGGAVFRIDAVKCEEEMPLVSRMTLPEHSGAWESSISDTSPPSPETSPSPRQSAYTPSVDSIIAKAEAHDGIVIGGLYLGMSSDDAKRMATHLLGAEFSKEDWKSFDWNEYYTYEWIGGSFNGLSDDSTVSLRVLKRNGRVDQFGFGSDAMRRLLGKKQPVSKERLGWLFFSHFDLEGEVDWDGNLTMTTPEHEEIKYKKQNARIEWGFEFLGKTPDWARASE